MRFSEYTYQRPDLDNVKAQFTALLTELEQANTFEGQSQAIEKIAHLRSEFESMQTICSIRHSVDTRNAFYKEENNFFDTHYPELNEYTNNYYRLLLRSPFRQQLEEQFGKRIFTIAELSLKTFEPHILEDVVQENHLATEYEELKAQAIIDYNGKTYNLSTIIPLLMHKDRKVRLDAVYKKWEYFAKNSQQIERIYHDLVQVRHKMATKLGYKNYIELGYARMQRSDYNADMIAQFRKQILEHIVPQATKLFERQRKRLGIESLQFHDEGYQFPSGNPTPKGGVEWQAKQARQMYAELSKETDEFFTFMSERELMDLEAKDGKETGGYCAFISTQQSPFIFSNFNGTSGDVEVLTHEAGHAFQCYATSRNTSIYEYLWPTFEACEIHSMSMEFFTWPWMQLFFGEEVEKFKFSHLAGAVRFLPYGAAVDEFQHEVYANPDMTPSERNTLWRSIERKYQPHREYGDIEYLEKGGCWQQQTHIFTSPFYYIDYVLAQMCSFQFWRRSREDRESAWNDYVRLCKAGGTRSFLELVKLANLQSPFEPNCVANAIKPIADYLDSINDSAF